jgi:hypothetical protein
MFYYLTKELTNVAHLFLSVSFPIFPTIVFTYY